MIFSFQMKISGRLISGYFFTMQAHFPEIHSEHDDTERVHFPSFCVLSRIRNSFEKNE